MASKNKIEKYSMPGYSCDMYGNLCRDNRVVQQSATPDPNQEFEPKGTTSPYSDVTMGPTPAEVVATGHPASHPDINMTCGFVSVSRPAVTRGLPRVKDDGFSPWKPPGRNS